LPDATIALSQDFSHLSIDELDVSMKDINLPRVSSDRGTLTDEDHKKLDAQILATFRSDMKLNEEPSLPLLLSIIANGDKRLKSLTFDEAEELLKNNELISKALKIAWGMKAFGEVRQLGELIGTFWIFDR
jgi:hypothetical protein